MSLVKLLADTMMFSYGQFLVFDSAEKLPGSQWTNEHVAQGFARRDTTVSVGALLEFGAAELGVWKGLIGSLEEYERVISISLNCSSGILCFEGPEEAPVCRNVSVHPGIYGVAVAQRVVDERTEVVDIFLREIESLIPSKILKADTTLGAKHVLMETAETAS